MPIRRFKHLFSGLATAGLLLAGLLVLLEARAATVQTNSTRLFVTSGGVGDCSQADPCGLQAALGGAGDGDTIFVAGGTYTGLGTAVVSLTQSVTLVGGWDGVPTGDAVLDPETYRTILDGERSRRVVYIGRGITPTVHGFNIIRGSADGLVDGCPTISGNPDGCGGGIFAYDAHPVLVNNVISGNVAALTTAGYPTGTTGYGGGVYLRDADRAIVSGNTIISNAASTAYCGHGGGMAFVGTGDGALIEFNEVLSNAATTTDDTCAWGGGIAGGPEGTLILENLVERNRGNATGGGYGAGLYQWYGAAQYLGNSVRGNRGDDAVYLGGSASRFEANRVDQGLAGMGVYLIYGSGEGPTLINNVIARHGLGHSVFACGSASYPLTARLLHNTIVGAGTGTGVHVATGYVTLHMTNTVVAGHTCAITNPYPADSTLTADHTLFWDNTNDGIRGTDAFDGDPRFVDAGGGDYHVALGSMAIDKGVDTGVMTDKEGVPRPQGAAPDLGAYEFHTQTLDVRIVGAGSVTQEPTGPVYKGLVVTMTGVPDPGWRFTGWSGDIESTENPLTFTIEGDTIITATFTEGGYSLDVNIVGQGDVDVDPDQAAYAHGQAITLTATQDPGWSFGGWSGDVESTENPVTFTIKGDTTVTATFIEGGYTLNVSIVGQGDVDADPEKPTYSHGEVVTLTATADPGWSFAGWSGDVESLDNPLQVVLHAHTAVTATFTPDSYTLDVSILGQGEVDVSPDQATYGYGVVVTLTPAPGPGWTFDGWAGPDEGDLVDQGDGSWTVVMDGDKSVTALFGEVPPGEVTLTVHMVGNGSVILNPAGGVYPVDEMVQLMAEPAPGWRFLEWSGDLSGSANPENITMDDDKTVTATFVETNVVYLPLVLANH